MIETSQRVRIFRLVVLMLALFFFILPSLEGDPLDHLVRFRYLTYWGFYCSLFVAGAMVLRSYNLTTSRLDGFVGSTIVVNILVVFLYWKLYFEDPSLVNDGAPAVWWREYYLHLTVQLLMWFDAFVIFGAFRKWFSSLKWLFGLMIVYILAIEFVLTFIFDTPAGSVTKGLPYPFLNDMEVIARLKFYGTTIATSVVFFFIAFGLSFILKWLKVAPSEADG